MIPAPAFDDAGSFIPQEWERPIPGETTMIKDQEVIAVRVETGNPIEFSSPIASAARTLSTAFAKGILPWPGSLLQQPARALRAVHLWDMAISELTERRSARLSHG